GWKPTGTAAATPAAEVIPSEERSQRFSPNKHRKPPRRGLSPPHKAPAAVTSGVAGSGAGQDRPTPRRGGRGATAGLPARPPPREPAGHRRVLHKRFSSPAPAQPESEAAPHRVATAARCRPGRR